MRERRLERARTGPAPELFDAAGRRCSVARREPTVENLHQWRKRTKDLWYHLRMLKPMAPAIVGGHADEADELSDLLGDDHDLAILRETLRRRRRASLAVDIDAVIELIDHRREQLQAEALLVGDAAVRGAVQGVSIGACTTTGRRGAARIASRAGRRSLA